jgi:hypothetical protein
MNSKVNPYDGISLDRNNGDVLSQLQGNPFALSIHGALGAGGKVN